KRAYCLKTQPATGETYPKSDLFNKAGYMLRHKVKPGITGLAQIKGWRGETDTLEKMQKRVEYDLEYIREWSLWLDLKIIFLTVFKGFVNKSAY
ncbi:sugar transferase, partial [Klebsiella pneumoniae]|uniref:sugar transferase n=1 Tax=Klebsiella pneumoniae TaxID=573 RepID=UPI00376F1CC0